MIDPLGTFNLLEASLWFVLAGIIYFFPVFTPDANKHRSLRMAGLLILFGVSDLVEISTGAWWRPWWLFLWKAFCLAGMVWLVISYFKKKGHLNAKR